MAASKAKDDHLKLTAESKKISDYMTFNLFSSNVN
jgi:hypothetical protein